MIVLLWHKILVIICLNVSYHDPKLIFKLMSPIFS